MGPAAAGDQGVARAVGRGAGHGARRSRHRPPGRDAAGGCTGGPIRKPARHAGRLSASRGHARAARTGGQPRDALPGPVRAGAGERRARRGDERPGDRGRARPSAGRSCRGSTGCGAWGSGSARAWQRSLPAIDADPLEHFAVVAAVLAVASLVFMRGLLAAHRPTPGEPRGGARDRALDAGARPARRDRVLLVRGGGRGLGLERRLHDPGARLVGGAGRGGLRRRSRSRWRSRASRRTRCAAGSATSCWCAAAR